MITERKRKTPAPPAYAFLRLTQQQRRRKNAAARVALAKLLEMGDEQEQRETFEFLKKALNERANYRKIFP